jgi:hypothetical protein
MAYRTKNWHTTRHTHVTENCTDSHEDGLGMWLARRQGVYSAVYTSRTKWNLSQQSLTQSPGRRGPEFRRDTTFVHGALRVPQCLSNMRDTTEASTLRWKWYESFSASRLLASYGMWVSARSLALSAAFQFKNAVRCSVKRGSNTSLN